MPRTRQQVVSTVGPVVNQPQTTGRNNAATVPPRQKRTYKPRQPKTTATVTAPEILPPTVNCVPTSVSSEDNLLFNDSGLASSPTQYSEQPRIVHFSPPYLRAQSTVNPQPVREPPASANDQIALLIQETRATARELQETRDRLSRMEQSQRTVQLQPVMPKLPKLNQFSGEATEDFELFREDLANMLSRQPYTEEQKIQVLQSFLTGNARYTFQGLPEYQRMTFADCISNLRKIFACTTMHEWLEELEQLKHKPSEDYRVFGAKITRIVLKAYPTDDMTPMAVESLKVNHFLRGINADLAEMIRRRQPKLLDVATEMAKVHEVQIPQLQGVAKRKISDAKKSDSAKQLMLMEPRSEQSELDSDLEIMETPNKKAKTTIDKIQLSQVSHEVKNNNKQTSQKICEVKKQMDALENKLSTTVEHLHLLQNNYQAALTQTSQPPVLHKYQTNNRNGYHQPPNTSYYQRQNAQYHQRQPSSYSKSYHQKPSQGEPFRREVHFAKSPLNCYGCGEPDHLKRDCPKFTKRQAFTHHHHHHGPPPGQSRPEPAQNVDNQNALN